MCFETNQKTGHGPYNPQVTCNYLTCVSMYCAVLRNNFLDIFSIFSLFLLTSLDKKLWGALKHLFVLHFLSSTNGCCLLLVFASCSCHSYPPYSTLSTRLPVEILTLRGTHGERQGPNGGMHIICEKVGIYLK